MFSISFRQCAALAVVLSLSAPLIAIAQDMPGSSASTSASSTKAQQKAQRKAARKEARAKRNAELKKLEDNGYNPATSNEASYPQDLQNAEKKAAKSGGASQ